MIIFVGKQGEARLIAQTLYPAITGSKIGRLSYEEGGKPCFERAAAAITHCDGIELCAVSRAPVGIDMERTDRQTSLDGGIAGWTELESCVKMTGEGITHAALETRPERRARLRRLNIFAEYYVTLCGGDEECYICETDGLEDIGASYSRGERIRAAQSIKTH